MFSGIHLSPNDSASTLTRASTPEPPASVGNRSATSQPLTLVCCPALATMLASAELMSALLSAASDAAAPAPKALTVVLALVK